MADDYSKIMKMLKGPQPEDQYNTDLSPEEKNAYSLWAAKQNQSTGRDVMRDLHDYDMQGFWKSNPDASIQGHLTDQFKKPNHPTFSNQSQYSNDQNQGGQWLQDQFFPSEQMLKKKGKFYP